MKAKRVLWAIAAVLLIAGGSTALAIGMQPEPIGGAQPGDAAVYRVIQGGEMVGNLTVVRGADSHQTGPDGGLRFGATYMAEWTIEGVRYASETVHVSPEGTYSHYVGPVYTSSATMTFEPGGSFGESVSRQTETITFDGPANLCGFILGEARDWSHEEELAGCGSSFSYHEQRDHTWSGDVFVKVYAGDKWPAMVEQKGERGRTYLRSMVGEAEAWEVADGSPARTPTPGPVSSNGPDPGDLVAWPLEEAIEAAQEDLQFNALRNHLERYPDSGLVEARFRIVERDGRVQDTWYMVWSDGTGVLTFEAFRAVPKEPSPIVPMQDLLSVYQEISFRERDNDWSQWPSPAERPTRMPSGPAVAEAWRAFTDHDDAPDYFAFDMRCDPDCGGGSVRAGYAHLMTSNTGYVTVCGPACVIAGVYNMDILRVDENGSFMDIHRERSAFETDNFLAADAGDPPGPGFARLTVVPAGAGVALIGIAALIALLWKTAPLAGLFSRIHGDQALQSPARRRLLDIIEANPGIHHNEVVRLGGHGKGGTDHHLRTLVRTGHVVEKRQPGFVCYFGKGAVDRRLMEAMPALKAGLARRILDHVRENPGSSGSDLARATGAENSTVSYHVKRLENAGLVSKRRLGRAIGVFPEALADQALALAA